MGGRSQSLSDDDRENDSGTVIEEHYHELKGDVADPCFEDEDDVRLSKCLGMLYGIARDKRTGEMVALKKVKLEHEGNAFPITALREINILLSFDHPSLVRAKEIVMGDLDRVSVVKDYVDHDLKGVLEVMKHPFSISEVKCLMIAGSCTEI